MAGMSLEFWVYVSRSRVMDTSCLACAMLDFQFPVSYDKVDNGSIRILDPTNVKLAIGILFLSCLEAESLVLPVLSSLYLIFHFRVHLSMSALPSPASLAQKMAGVLLEFCA